MHGAEDAVVDTLRQWVEKAEHDLKNAARVLTLGEDCPTDTVCFHAQQCIEKYQKALLVLKLIDFPKTHDLNALARLMPDPLLPMLTDTQRRRLTEYATVLRYPGDEEPLTLAEARAAVQLARRVRARVRKLLPRESLRRRSA
ncbi:MAG: HEPN domain-containing protein [Candidatus Omnitrophica bacterium]|nr:HEPN domain-containing protein [Candidatus Omnitrophota bacterium]